MNCMIAVEVNLLFPSLVHVTMPLQHLCPERLDDLPRSWLNVCQRDRTSALGIKLSPKQLEVPM
eukprot:CAMPEP_0115731940 /NCGR_PEP_ID=MMETSP0272-20121206/84852_1 /TAXON_ID=71861 /ORGANISM="Scrippsiella trochoidea, Strain CCMP3099" /LENGTH=63 /DNA_ID=CAMNT_0003175809 /DNA_START=80 /DNA_END=268 /DNA_ORIENTATION=+